MRRALSVAVVLLLAVVPVLSGCGNSAKVGRSSIYTVASASGKLMQAGGALTLELSGVSPTSTRYVMRPNREDFTVTTNKLISSWGKTFGDSTVAALSIDAHAGDDAAVMSLGNPKYDDEKGTLSFSVGEAPAGDGPATWKGESVSALPGSFTASTLFIQQASDDAVATPILVEDGAVSMSFRGQYYYVNVDMTRGVSHRELGEQYARAMNRINRDAEFRISIYVNTMILLLATEYGVSGSELIKRADQIKKNMPREYLDEIDGLASGMRSYFPLSASNLMYLYNLLSDVFRWTQCSAMGVWGPSSSAGTNVMYRTLDWYEGMVDEMTEIHAITRYHYADRDVHIIGALGHLGCITGISTTDAEGRNGIMGAIMDANVSGTKYSAEGCRSYNFDLRSALERLGTKEEIAAYLSDKPYTFSNLILLADSAKTIVLENNISGEGEAPSRAVRDDVSVLNPGIEWGFPAMIGAVNAFCLKGQVNNFSRGVNGEINVERWNLLRKRIDELNDSANGYSLTPEDVKEIMMSFAGRRPGSLEADEGDLYNQQSQQMAFYIPRDAFLQVFFKPLDGSTPKEPKLVNIPLERAQ